MVEAFHSERYVAPSSNVASQLRGLDEDLVIELHERESVTTIGEQRSVSRRLLLSHHRHHQWRGIQKHKFPTFHTPKTQCTDDLQQHEQIKSVLINHYVSSGYTSLDLCWQECHLLKFHNVSVPTWQVNMSGSQRTVQQRTASKLNRLPTAQDKLEFGVVRLFFSLLVRTALRLHQRSDYGLTH